MTRASDPALSDIRFLAQMPMESHPRYAAFAPLMGSERFADYQEVFERGFVETSIMTGRFVRLDHLPPAEGLRGGEALERLLGSYQRAERTELAVDYLREYEGSGRDAFMARVMELPYARYVRDEMTARYRRGGPLTRLLGRWRGRRQSRMRVETFLTLYDNMKRFDGLVGDAQVTHDEPVQLGAADVPWAIGYPGYLRLREGSHRRAVAISLGWETIPTLVFEFERVTKQDVGSSGSYLHDRFDWFSEQITAANQAA